MNWCAQYVARKSSSVLAIHTYARLAKVNMLGNNVIDTNDFLCDVLVQSCQKRAIPEVKQSRRIFYAIDVGPSFVLCKSCESPKHGLLFATNLKYTTIKMAAERT